MSPKYSLGTVSTTSFASWHFQKIGPKRPFLGYFWVPEIIKSGSPNGT
nr:MAG TPA: hypothetical protein [Caudoviricetes sp.]